MRNCPWSFSLVLVLGVGLAAPATAQSAPSVPDPKNPARIAPATPEKKSESGATAPAQPAGRQKILDELYERLAKASDPAEARGIAGAIERVWMRSGSDTADLVMERVTQTMRKRDWKLATELLDRLVEIEPQWAEAWSKRASVRFFADDLTGAMEDLAFVLHIEPRHYSALIGMGTILERHERNAAALRVYRRVLEINPSIEPIRRKVEKLTLEVDGRDI